MNRRDFLDARRFASAAGPLLAAHDVNEPETPPSDLALIRLARRAMATQFEIALPVGTPQATLAAEAALDLIDQLEGQLTVYRETSEVSRLNRCAAAGPVPVEAKLFELLALSKRLHEASDGAFDIAVGALIKAWGFFKRQGRVPDETERAQALARGGMAHVDLDAPRRAVSFERRGLELNLGSIGKGYALDRAGEQLRGEWGVGSALLHGGFSSLLGLGAPPAEPRGWAVGIHHPWNPRLRLVQVWLKDRALGTSSATYQHVQHEGRKLGHLLDPRTGWPAEGMASASALAPTAAEADALATIFFIQGVDWTRNYCANHPEVGAVLLEAKAAVPVVLGSANGKKPRFEPRPSGSGHEGLRGQ